MCYAQDKTQVQAEMLANRLQKRFRHLKKWAQRTVAGAFRLYDRDIPEIPLVLDYYGDVCLPQEAAVSGALYKRPYEKDEDDEERWLSAMKDSAALTLGVDPERVFLKQRQRQRGTSQYEKMDKAQFTKIVSEGGLAFKVNLSDYLDTGLFPDRRLLRAMVRTEAAGKKVLNLFSYTGSFSVYAASGGALSTDSIDLSNTYLSWARENFSLNGFSASLLQQWDFFSRSCPNSAHKLIRADVLDFLEKAAAAKMRWDIIILDPPAFSNSKKMTGSFDLNRDMTELVSSCMGRLASGGKIFLSVNTRRQAVTAVELETELRVRLAPNAENLRVTDLSDKIIDEDFKGKKTPKGFLITL
ncbi:MAG: class I SAM-dependent methyltransferase [Treponema sp.]|jgi:23S rRNA G2069 N7-methylase RlmK/C1962 C5-methylase RlmI|nr:class I SAM-dependent methyltransferase [Treponema sp.]